MLNKCKKFICQIYFSFSSFKIILFSSLPTCTCPFYDLLCKSISIQTKLFILKWFLTNFWEQKLIDSNNRKYTYSIIIFLRKKCCLLEKTVIKAILEIRRWPTAQEPNSNKTQASFSSWDQMLHASKF